MLAERLRMSGKPELSGPETPCMPGISIWRMVTETSGVSPGYLAAITGAGARRWGRR